jgi:hypothetical protein
MNLLVIRFPVVGLVVIAGVVVVGFAALFVSYVVISTFIFVFITL